MRHLLFLMVTSVALGNASALDSDPSADLLATVTQQQTAPLNDIPAGHWAQAAVNMLIQNGLITGFPGGTFQGDQTLTRYEAAVIFARFLGSTQYSAASLRTEQVQTLTRGLLEVSEELKLVMEQLDAINKKDAVQDARLSGVEGALARMNDAVTGLAQTSESKVDERLKAVEGSIQTLPEVVNNLTPKAEHDALAARVAALEQKSAAPTTTQATVSLPNTPPGVTAPLLPFPDGSSGPAPLHNNYFSLSGGKAFGTGTGWTLGAVLGSRELVGPIGGQLGLQYDLTTKALSADLAGTLQFGNPASLSPYLGAGLGLTYGPSRTSGQSSDLYALGFGGVSYSINSRFGVFAEGNFRYFLTNKGVGTGLDSSSTNGLGTSAKIGIQLKF